MLYKSTMSIKRQIAAAVMAVFAACGGSKPPAKVVDPAPVAAAPVESVPSTPAESIPVAEKPPVEPPVDAKADALKVEMAAYERAKPIFVANCARCHSKGQSKASAKKLGHFDMTSYPFTGHHAATIGDEISEVLGQSGKPATMPIDKRGAVKGDDLALMMAWSAAWTAAEKLGAH
jgi:mono/diheme cytochrome c family protein